MSALLVAAVLAAGWSDASGRLRCAVSDAFTPRADQPWQFTRGDGLRKVVFLTVKPVAEGPTARAQALLGRLEAAPLGTAEAAAAGTLPGAPALAAAFAIAPLEPTWAGVLVLGPPAADVLAEARALASECHAVTPAVDAGRIRDVTRRLSAAIPPGMSASEVRGAGAIQGEGFTARLTSVQPMGKSTLAEVAAAWLAPSGARVEATSTTVATADARPVAIASGTLLQGGVDYIIIVAAVDLGNGEVGGISVSASAGVQSRARLTLEELLRSLRIER